MAPTRTQPSVHPFHLENALLSHYVVVPFYLQIMMLKLRGHPPVLMKKSEGEMEGKVSNHLSKVSCF